MKRLISGVVMAMLMVNVLALSFNVKPAGSSPVTLIVPDNYPTIQAAVNAASPGDIVYVRTGTYPENVVVGKTLSLVGENLQNTIIDGGGIGNVVNITADGVKVIGFNVRNSTSVYPQYCTGIYLEGASHCDITGNNITNNGDGILVKSSSSNTVHGNNITNNKSHGIWLRSSSNNSISGNNITANNGWGIVLAFSSNNNTIYGNNITNNDCGIGLYSSSNYNSISGNDITNNSYDGISLYSSSNYNSISENVFVDDGMVVYDSYGNVVMGNLVNGKPLIYLDSVSDVVVEDAGQVILVECINITVENLSLFHTYFAIQLWNTNNSEISGNNITNNGGDGIWLRSSSNNSISGNNITANSYGGVELYSSSNTNNSVSGNNITANNGFGIWLSESNNNSLSGNNITNNGCGILLYSSSNYNSISGNDITNNSYDGIGLGISSNNSISGNDITNNSYDGIGLGISSNNSVSGNNITANNDGISLSVSSNNSIYHNSLIDNTREVYDCAWENPINSPSINVWDDGYPSGGNYWSDYESRYPGASEIDGLGIWDTPYVIDQNNRDNYPLMNPWPGGEVDKEPPTIRNVRHEPLYPMENETIHFYACVTDNVAVANVYLNYTLNGGATWLLKEMTMAEGGTYSTSLGPYNQFQLIGFIIIANDNSGNWAYGSEIVLRLPGPPEVAPVVVSPDPPNPSPNGVDVRYETNETGTRISVNVNETGLYKPGLYYNVSYSHDGGITWTTIFMQFDGGYFWSCFIPYLTNILFKIQASDGSLSRVYWIIVGPWKYPIYLYFSTDEQYLPVAGLDFDGNSTVEDNWVSYETTRDYWKIVFQDNDIDHDGTRDVWAYAYMNPKSLDDGCLVIEYWIYYAFNEYVALRPIFCGNHEHDFESIYLWIDVATGGIKKMTLSQHNFVNHYTFDSSPKRINVAVEKGGHGMALLKDDNADGFPDDNDGIPGYDIWQPEGGGTMIGGQWTDQSLVGALYPWVIYDPRIPSSEPHLFGDSSVLTTGLSLEALNPLLPGVVGKIPQYYGWLTNLLETESCLKTSYGAPLKYFGLPDDSLVFMVTAPWYRQEFQHASEMWDKVPWATYASKIIIKTLLPFITAGIFSYWKAASLTARLGKAIIDALTGFAVGKIITTLFDPVQGSVLDSQGNVLGYKDGQMTSKISGGFVFLNRNETDDLYDLFMVMTNSSDLYEYETTGTKNGDTYNFSVTLDESNGDELKFDAIMIPTNLNEVHRFIVDWEILEGGGQGVKVSVDRDRDGAYEHVFLSDAVLTGDEFAAAIAGPTVESCNSTGMVKDSFDLSDSVYVKGEGYSPSATYDLYVVSATTWSDGMPIPQRIEGTATTITSDISGNIPVTPAWNAPITLGNYDIVVDVNRDGYYNSSIDALDQSNVQIRAGFQTIPEFLQTAILIALMITTMQTIVLVRKKRFRSHCRIQQSSKTGKPLSASGSAAVRFGRASALKCGDCHVIRGFPSVGTNRRIGGGSNS